MSLHKISSIAIPLLCNTVLKWINEYNDGKWLEMWNVNAYEIRTFVFNHQKYIQSWKWQYGDDDDEILSFFFEMEQMLNTF